MLAHGFSAKKGQCVVAPYHQQQGKGQVESNLVVPEVPQDDKPGDKRRYHHADQDGRQQMIPSFVMVPENLGHHHQNQDSQKNHPGRPGYHCHQHNGNAKKYGHHLAGAQLLF